MLIFIVDTGMSPNCQLHGTLHGTFTDLHGPPVFNTFRSYPCYPSYPRVTEIHQSDYLRSTPGWDVYVVRYYKNSEHPVSRVVVQFAADPSSRYVEESWPGPKLGYAPSKPNIEQHGTDLKRSGACDRFWAPGWIRPGGTVTASRDLHGIFTGLR